VGADPKGVLNGVADFCVRSAGRAELGPLTLNDPRAAFDSLGIFYPRVGGGLAPVAAPAVRNRGIWTWGYVIYDYQRYLDNMARLKMNMIVIWNDAPPLNSRDIIAYAHARGIRVIAGFHWGWGNDHLSLTNPDHRRLVKQQVLDTYNNEYHGLGYDGIYFQTITEHKDTVLDGVTVAAAACAWVNDIGRTFLDRHPGLLIQFGLHATSIMDNYADLKDLDPHIEIIWEDAGVTPYTYTPTLSLCAGTHLEQHGVGTLEGTIAYSRKLASFRGNVGFGLCPKGWANLDWDKEFEHHGSFIMGRQNRALIRRRLESKQPWWDRINRDWIPCYGAAARFYLEICRACPGPVTAVGLVEDGLFETRIQPSVATFAETLWNPGQPESDLLAFGHSPLFNSLD